MSEESCYGSFEVLIGRDKVGLDEIKAEVIDWIQENWNSISKENISAVHYRSCNLGRKTVFKIGDRVRRKVNGKPWYGTVVAVSPCSPDVVVRFDNGALRHIAPYRLTVLG